MVSAGVCANELLRIHHEVTKAIIAQDLEAVLSAIGVGLGWQMGVFWEVDRANQVLTASTVWVAHGVNVSALESATRRARYAPYQGRPGRSWSQRATFWERDLAADPSFLRAREAGECGFASAIYFPIGELDDVLGVIELFRTATTAPDGEVLDALHAMGSVLGLYLRSVRDQQAKLATEQRFRAEVEHQVHERTRELKASQAKLQRLYESDIIGILIGTYDGQIVDANDAFLQLIGYSRQELTDGSLRWDACTPPEWAQADRACVQQLQITGVAASYEKEFLRKDGTRVPIILGAAVLDDIGGAISFVIDITDRKRVERDFATLSDRLEARFLERTAELRSSEAQAAESERQLRALALRLMKLREETGTAIAREIHDVLGQELTAIKMDASFLVRRLAGTADTMVLDRLYEIVACTDRIVTTIRRISTDLRPQILDDLGLVAAVRWCAREFSSRSGMQVNVDVPSDASIDRDRSTAVFRIMQELLTNVARHADAKHVDLSLRVVDQRIELRVRDDGKGFTPTPKSSLGLAGIRERALAFGGSFAIHPLSDSDQHGTDAVVSIPLSP